MKIVAIASALVFVLTSHPGSAVAQSRGAGKAMSTTTAEVVARLTKNWDADVKAYDEVYRHILMMSDALSDGIIAQFPEKFSA
jgi:hypothetical protein